MKKISNIKLGRIVLDRNINKKFLNFENNQDIFCDGTQVEYYSALYNYIRRLVYNSRIASEVILNKSFVSNVIRIIKQDVLVKEDLKEIVYLELIHYLIVYYDTIKIIKLSGTWPYTEKDKKIRKDAIKLLNSQIQEIETFLHEINYSEKVSELLENFKENTISKKELTNEEFEDLDLIFSTAHNIPQDYLDLYFKNIIKCSKKPSLDALKNALSSFISNYALSYGTYCYLDICNLNFGTLGTYDNHVIAISDKVFNNFYLNQFCKKRNLFDIVFHELTHLLQEELYKNDTLPYEYIIMLQDYLLSNVLSNKYSDDNYMSLYNELDARRSSLLKTDEYFIKLGVIPKENTLKSINRDERRHKNDARYYDKKEKSVDVLFNENIKEVIRVLKEEFRIDIFTSYPVLNYLYHRDGTRKTTLELIIEKNHTKDEKSIEQINDILRNRKLSKEEISKDLEELILDDNQDIIDDKDRMIDRLNKLLTTKERSKLLIKLNGVMLKMQEFTRGLAVFYCEMNDLQMEANNILADGIMQHRLKKENINRD